MKQSFPIILASTAALILVLPASAGTIYFSDDFESGLGQWNPGQAITVPISGKGMVMTFTGQAAGGDAVSVPFSVPNVPNLFLSFDYMGGGGYIGINPGSEDWLAGEAGYSSAIPGYVALCYGPVWHHYSIPLPPGITGSIILEDFVGASSHGAFFDNIVIGTDLGISIPRCPDSVPVAPLLGTCLAPIVATKRKRHCLD